MAVTTGMIGHGFYNRHSAPQWAATEYVLPWLEDAIGGMSFDGDAQAVGIADFGCSEGANSMRVTKRLVEAIRARTAKPIQSIHSDLPTNDFTTLLCSLRTDGRPLFGETTYSAIVGGSMFNQLLPPATTHLAMTFNAIGFLSRKPVERLPGYILPNGPSADRGVGKVTTDERRVFAEQAAADLEAFLRARAAELVPGGTLLVEVFGAGDEARTCDGIYDVLNDAVLEALDDGLIGKADYEAYYQPVYFRTLEELTAPVERLGGQFKLERAEIYEVPVPFVEDHQRSGDIETYAKEYTNFFRAFTEAVLCAAFPAHDPKPFADDIFGRAERLVREYPDRYVFRYVSVAMLLTRLAD